MTAKKVIISIDDEKIYNHKGKNFSRILQDYENKLLMYLYDCFSFKKIKMMSLIFDGILLSPKTNISIHDIENYLLIGWQAYRGDQIHRINSPT